MDNKITLPKFTAMMAEKSGYSKRRCEDFLREFFQTLSRNLENGEEVTVKGLGAFRLSTVEPRKSVDVSTGEPIEIPGHVKVVFTPAKEMAEAVNAPFEFFEAVEASDDLTDEEVTSEEIVESSLQTEEPSVPQPEEQPEEEPQMIEEEAEEEAEEESEEEPQQIEEQSQPEELLADEDPQPIEETTIEPEVEEESEEEIIRQSEPVEKVEPTEETVKVVKEVKHHRFGTGFVWGFVAGVVVLALGLFVGYKIIEYKLTQDFTNSKEAIAVVEESPAPVATTSDSDSTLTSQSTSAEQESEKTPDKVMQDIPADKVATKASDEPKYDTISKTRYLTTMAKEYYGDYNLWPYIYEANHDILGHPDRIRPGTRVRIPDLKDYGVDPKNPNDIRRAKRKGIEIYSRYK